jgi:hypothetical protein
MVNAHLYRSVENAIKRTGKTKGGTEYIDYSPQIEKDINSLNMSAGDMVLGSLVSPELTAATTFGRVSYEQDPKTGDIIIYDSYDFNKTPEKSTVYSKIRSKLGENSQEGKANIIGRFNPNETQEPSFTDVLFNPIDALNIRYGDVKEFTDKVKEKTDTIVEELGKKANKAKNYLSKKASKAKDYLSNLFEDGGMMGASGYPDKVLNEFGNGGTHEQNPLGGIPLGIGSNGKMNTVEEDETSYTFKEGKFIFSNRIRYEE